MFFNIRACRLKEIGIYNLNNLYFLPLPLKQPLNVMTLSHRYSVVIKSNGSLEDSM